METVVQELRPREAALAILSAMAILGLIDNFVVYVAERGSLWQFHAVRSAMALALLVGFAALRGHRLRPKRPGRVAARSLLISTSMVLYFGSLAFLPLGQVAAGLFTSPIFVVLVSRLRLGKRIGPAKAAAVALGFAGILLVLRPSAGALSPVSLVPVVAGLFYALAAVSTRSWCGEENVWALLSGFFAALGLWGLLGVVVLTAWPHGVPAGADGFILRGWTPLDAGLWGWITVQCLGSLVAVGLITRAYSVGEAAQVAIFEYALLIFAAAWGLSAARQQPGAAGVLGMAMIAGAGVLIARASEGQPAAPVPVAPGGAT